MAIAVSGAGNEPCGLLECGPDGTIVSVNQTLLGWTGYCQEQLVGVRRFSDLLTAGGRIYHETHYAPMLSLQGSVREIALELVCSDGSRLPVLLNSVADRDEHGNVSVVRTAVFDATERRAYERELLRAKEAAEAAEERATALARTLQQTLIPPAPPHIPGLDVAAAYRPSGRGDEVGGDFYDVFQIGSGDWVVVVGDVAGKGVEAAVVTALARYTLRGATVRSTSPARALSALNEVLLRDHTDRFCTAVLVRLRQGADGRWEATIAAGGHALPLLQGPWGEPHPVGRTGSLLGAFPNPSLHDTSVVLNPADNLVLYTDGVTEGRSGGEFFGDRRLRRSLLHHQGASARAIVEGVLNDVLQFQANNPRDDIAVVAVHAPEPQAGHRTRPTAEASSPG